MLISVLGEDEDDNKRNKKYEIKTVLTEQRVGAAYRYHVSAMLTNHQPKRVIKTIWPLIRSKFSLTALNTMLAAATSDSSAECHTHWVGFVSLVDAVLLPPKAFSVGSAAL